VLIIVHQQNERNRDRRDGGVWHEDDGANVTRPLEVVNARVTELQPDQNTAD
jgi:hypothetical protein